MSNETILEEAARITSGARQAKYGHPRQNFARIAKIWSALLEEKLKPGVELDPEDIALMMIGGKLARESHVRDRDNLVDIAGYARNIEMLSEKETS